MAGGRTRCEFSTSGCVLQTTNTSYHKRPVFSHTAGGWSARPGSAPPSLASGHNSTPYAHGKKRPPAETN